MTRSQFIHLLKIGSATLAVIIVVVYAIWRSLNYARGPAIVISDPSNGSSVATHSVVVTGQALRVKDLTLNGNTVLIDESGNFRETIVIFPGINSLSLVARDQFGRETTDTLTLFGSADMPVEIPAPKTPGTNTGASTTNLATSTSL